MKTLHSMFTLFVIFLFTPPLTLLAGVLLLAVLVPTSPFILLLLIRHGQKLKEKQKAHAAAAAQARVIVESFLHPHN